jgi:NADH-quinone oxidoreductase subunit L
MSGFKRAMPFTFACFVVGGLALSGLPPFSGWLSKDDILGYLLHRGSWFPVLGVLGYAGAALTGVYTFRMIFRAFFGAPCKQAEELEQGHLYHAHEPTNPMTGEVEDTEIGFPGPEHAIAEREWPMKVAMSLLALGAIIGGAIQIPGVDDKITQFLAPTFVHDRLAHLEPSNGNAWLGLIIGALIAVAGISVAYILWVREAGIPQRLQARFKPLHTFLLNKWYFDELIDLVIVRPALLLGRATDTVLERIFVGGTITDGTVATVRATSAAVRRVQTGYTRYYAALMVVGVFGVALYFLISAS